MKNIYKNLVTAKKLKEYLSISVLLLLNLALASYLYHFNTQKDLRYSAPSRILLQKSQPRAGESIPLERTVGKGVSLFMEINTRHRPKNNFHHTLLHMEASGDSGKRFPITLYLAENGTPRVYWDNLRISSARDAVFIGKMDYRAGDWNRIGLVLRPSRGRRILTVSLNGKILWLKSLPPGKLTIQGATILPSEKKINETDIDNPPPNSGPFVGSCRGVLMLDHALTREEIGDSFRCRKPPYLLLKLFIMFILSSTISAAAFRIFRNIILIKQDCGAAGKEQLQRAAVKLVFFGGINLLFFMLFNLGGPAGYYFFNMPSHTGEGIYFFVLVLLTLSLLLTFVLEKLTGESFRRCLPVPLAIVGVLVFTLLLSSFPRIGDIYPFFFNLLFSLAFTLLLGSMDIIQLKPLTEKSDER